MEFLLYYIYVLSEIFDESAVRLIILPGQL